MIVKLLVLGIVLQMLRLPYPVVKVFWESKRGRYIVLGGRVQNLDIMLGYCLLGDATPACNNYWTGVALVGGAKAWFLLSDNGI